MTVRPGPPGSLLNLDPSRPPVAPSEAATLVLLRETPGDVAGGHETAVEVFCVERSRKSRFMGGAVVFPGGKVEDDDHSSAWDAVLSAPHPRVSDLADTESLRRALAVAACRESLEEAAILPVEGTLTHADALLLRSTLADSVAALRAALTARGITIDLASLVPFARWVTPAAEARRFDARFFMLRAPAGQEGTHDAYETMSSFWATPAAILRRWRDKEIQLAPPTHHTLLTLSRMPTVEAALAAAVTMPLTPIHPHLIDFDGTMALTLPGDPDHPQADRLIDGKTRYVLRNEQWCPE